MSREELIKAYRLAHADWMKAEEYEDSMYEAVKETSEYKKYKEAQARSQSHWKQKNEIENECWRDCERTGENFDSVFQLANEDY